MDVMVPEELELLAVAAVAATLLKKKKRRKRRVWAKDWLGKKESMSHVNLLQELKSEPVDCRTFLYSFLKELLMLFIFLVTASLLAPSSFDFNFSTNRSYAAFLLTLSLYSFDFIFQRHGLLL